MSMSTHVIGIKPPDETWKKMKTAWEACEAAGIDPPKEVLAFFDHVKPDERGVVVDLKYFCNPESEPKKTDLHPAVTKYKAEMQEGFEVDVTKLPLDVKIIRFYNSW